MKTKILGDVHGGFKGMMQCFERSKFDYKKDRLIVLGDVCDGWPETKQCIDELLKVKNLVYLLGNHDKWAYEWAIRGDKPEIWVYQGGSATLESYDYKGMPESHIKLLRSAPWYFEENNKLFVHAGLTDPEKPMKEQRLNDLIWDRELLEMAWHAQFCSEVKKVSIWDEIFLGHTTTRCYKDRLNRVINTPIHVCEVWDLDTGGGWGGKITIMDLDTKEYWQSDFVKYLYPNYKGR